MLTPQHELLSAEHFEWGRVAVLPWDSEHFGFGVGDYLPGDARAVASDRAGFGAAFDGWASRHGVELVAARAEPKDSLWRLLLSDLGFQFIDCSLFLELQGLSARTFPSPRHPTRLAVPEDHEAIVRMAEDAFRLDRYHADPRFPGRLAELRHRRWMQWLLSSTHPGSRTHVIGEPGRPSAFVNVVLENANLDMILTAVDPTQHARGIGTSLFAGMLAAMRNEGAERATGKVYSANGAILNILSHLGFRLTRSLAVFHWHAAEAPHLVPASRVWA
jgi:GNAT superfamily N-acetyltransferase